MNTDTLHNEAHDKGYPLSEKNAKESDSDSDREESGHELEQGQSWVKRTTRFLSKWGVETAGYVRSTILVNG